MDYNNVNEIKHQYQTLKKDTKLRDMLNKIFSGNIKHAFSSKVSKEKDCIDLSGGLIVVVNDKGVAYDIRNSEWGIINKI